MHRLTFVSFASFLAPLTLAAQARPIVPHDSVRGSIRTVDVRTRTLEVTTGVGFALRVVRLQVPADVPITNKERGQGEPIRLGELRPGDIIRAVFGGRATGFVAYTIERLGRMEVGVESTP